MIKILSIFIEAILTSITSTELAAGGWIVDYWRTCFTADVTGLRG